MLARLVVLLCVSRSTSSPASQRVSPTVYTYSSSEWPSNAASPAFPYGSSIASVTIGPKLKRRSSGGNGVARGRAFARLRDTVPATNQPDIAEEKQR